MIGARRALVGVTATLLGLSLLTSSGCRDHKAPTHELITALKTRTVPADVVDASPPVVHQRGFRLYSSWEFDLVTGWEEYRAWVRRRLAPDFRLLADEQRSMTFSKMTTADGFSLRVEAIQPKLADGGAELVRVRVSVEAGPT